MAISVVEVTRAHFPAWKRMRQALYSGLTAEFHDEEMGWIFRSDEAACFVVLAGDAVPIGFLELSLRNIVDGCLGGPVGYIEGIYLEAAHRGHGLGARLVEFARQWSLERGCRDLATDAELDNREAQAFFRDAGFAETWRVVGFTRRIDSE
jgi:aminoglycoside 6'-N-acetyltransferase I